MPKIWTPLAVVVLASASSGCVHIVREQDLLPGARAQLAAQAQTPELAIEAADGSILRGHTFTGANRPFVFVYFGGNGEIITADSSLGDRARRHGIDLYGVNYRGFPPSSGTASLAALTVATSRPVAGVVLQGAPSSAAEVVPKMRRALPWYARMWVRLRASPEVAAFKPKPIDLAPSVTAPLLSIHGTKDVVVAMQFGREVFDAAGSERKTWCPIRGGEHMGLWATEGSAADACLEKFLAELEN